MQANIVRVLSDGALGDRSCICLAIAVIEQLDGTDGKIGVTAVLADREAGAHGGRSRGFAALFVQHPYQCESRRNISGIPAQQLTQQRFRLSSAACLLVYSGLGTAQFDGLRMLDSCTRNQFLRRRQVAT